MKKQFTILLIIIIPLFLTGCSYKFVKVKDENDKNTTTSLNLDVLKTDEISKATSTLDAQLPIPTTPKATTKKTNEAPSQITENKNEETNNTQTLNKANDLIIHYAKSLIIFKEYKEFFESTKSIVNLRIDYINSRINSFNGSILTEFSNPDFDPDLSHSNEIIRKLDELINWYIGEHNKDLEASNFIINDLIKNAVVYVDERISSYNKPMDFLLNNPNEFVSEKKYNDMLTMYNLTNLPTLVEAKDNINKMMDALWKRDAYYKNEDAEILETKDKLANYFSAQVLKYETYKATSRESYTAIPQPSVYTPIHCTIDHDQFRSYVSCY